MDVIEKCLILARCNYEYAKKLIEKKQEELISAYYEEAQALYRSYSSI